MHAHGKKNDGRINGKWYKDHQTKCAGEIKLVTGWNQSLGLQDFSKENCELSNYRWCNHIPEESGIAGAAITSPPGSFSLPSASSFTNGAVLASLNTPLSVPASPLSSRDAYLPPGMQHLPHSALQHPQAPQHPLRKLAQQPAQQRGMQIQQHQHKRNKIARINSRIRIQSGNSGSGFVSGKGTGIIAHDALPSLTFNT